MRYLPMPYLPVITLLAVTLTGCATAPKSETPQAHKFDLFGLIKYKQQPNEEVVNNSSTLKTIDYANTSPYKNRFRIDPFSVGGWVNQNEGEPFKQVMPTTANSAIVYLYRTHSAWNHQEIVAPNFFLNDKRIPSLLDNHYYWIELPAGTYRLNISRPVGVIHFQKGTAVDFSVEAGKSYFLRYEEQKFRGTPNKTDGLLKAGPLMQMPTDQALREISDTTLRTPGYSFVKREHIDQPELAAFNGKAPDRINKKQLEEKKQLHLDKPFKLWNPLTW